MGQIVSNYMKTTYPNIKLNKCQEKCDMCKTNTIFNDILKMTSDEIDLYYESYKTQRLSEIFGEMLFLHDNNQIANDLLYLKYNNLPEVNYKNYGIFADLNINKLKLSDFASVKVINDFTNIKDKKIKFAIFMTDMYNTIVIPRLGSIDDLIMDDIFTYEIIYTNEDHTGYYILLFILAILVIMIFNL